MILGLFGISLPRLVSLRHRLLHRKLRELNTLKLAASETGWLDYWQCKYDETWAAIDQLERQYPGLFD